MRPASIFDRSRMSLIKASRCRPAPSTRSSGSSVLLQRLRILPQHLADADDGVERRAQLVAHIGEELRLVLARLGELAALVLDFVEQPHVLDRDHRLVGEGRHQLDLLLGERPHGLALKLRTPIGIPSRSIGTRKKRAKAARSSGLRRNVYSGSVTTSGM